MKNAQDSLFTCGCSTFPQEEQPQLKMNTSCTWATFFLEFPEAYPDRDLIAAGNIPGEV